MLNVICFRLQKQIKSADTHTHTPAAAEFGVKIKRETYFVIIIPLEDTLARVLLRYIHY